MTGFIPAPPKMVGQIERSCGKAAAELQIHRPALRSPQHGRVCQDFMHRKDQKGRATWFESANSHSNYIHSHT